MIIGNYNILEVKRATANGVYLADEDGNEVLLPKKFVLPQMKPGTKGKAFVYKDSEDRLVATTQKPLAIAGQAAVLRVRSVTGIGAFLDWGLDKDLFLPFAEQKRKVQEGEEVLVFVFLDRATERVAATTNVNQFIKNREVSLKKNEEVEILIGIEDVLGYRVVINDRHWGMLYKNELFTEVSPGERMKAFVKKVREDGKVDVALQKQGIDAARESTDVILDALAKNRGRMSVSDHTDAEEIQEMFGMSKKNFKKAIGILYKAGKIIIREREILLKK